MSEQDTVRIRITENIAVTFDQKSTTTLFKGKRYNLPEKLADSLVRGGQGKRVKAKIDPKIEDREKKVVETEEKK